MERIDCLSLLDWKPRTRVRPHGSSMYSLIANSTASAKSQRKRSTITYLKFPKTPANWRSASGSIAAAAAVRFW